MRKKPRISLRWPAIQGENAGAFALLLLADQQYQDGKYGDAEKTYNRFAEEYPKHPMLDAAFYGIGAVRESQADYAGAINSYQRVMEVPNAAHALDARMAIGRCLEATQQWKKAPSGLRRPHRRPVQLLVGRARTQPHHRPGSGGPRAGGESLTPPPKPASAPATIPQVLLPATPATPATPAAKP